MTKKRLEATAKELLDAAAIETLEKIRNDQEQVPTRLRPMLVYIERHLFDPDLNVNRLKEACGIRDNSVAIHFHAAVGKPPHAYISQGRLETAARLLRDTDLPIWKISELLGFSSIQVFSRAFYRWAEQRPTTFRREIRRRVKKSGRARSITASVPTKTAEFWRRALNGDLRDDEAADLIQKLLAIYPPGRRQTA